MLEYGQALGVPTFRNFAMSQDVLNKFNQYFEIIHADTDALRDDAYHLRYQVYCLETGFEDATDAVDQRETDAFDSRSVHSIIRYKCNGTPTVAAGVRLVLSDRNEPETPFPIEEHCIVSIQQVGFDPATIPRTAMAEVSRFAVSKDFKRRVGEANSLSGIGPRTDAYVAPKDGARLMPHLTLGLFAAIVQMSASNGITHWYAVMEPSLFRLLTRFGINFLPIGEMVDYHGMRRPCFGEIETVLAGIYDKRPDVWDFITSEGRYWPRPTHEVIEKSHRVNALLAG